MDEKYVMMATNFQEFKNIWCKSLSKVYLIRFMQTLNAYLDDSMQLTSWTVASYIQRTTKRFLSQPW